MKNFKNLKRLSSSTLMALVLALVATCRAPDPLIDFGAVKFAALFDAEHSAPRNGYFIMESPSKRDYVAIANDLRKTDTVLLGLDLSDFMQAGLDPQSMKNDDFKPGVMVYDLPTSSMVISCQLSPQLPATATATTVPFENLANPSLLFAALLHYQPSSLSYDKTSQGYGFTVQPGIVLEWVEGSEGKMSMSIVVDAPAFLNAGLHPDRLKVWKIELIKSASGATSNRLRLSFPLP